MFPSLISAENLSRTEIETLLARAAAIANGSSAKVQGKRIALALQNSALPLPIPLEHTMRDAGAAVFSIHSDADSLASISRQIKAINADAVLFSHPQSGSAHAVAAQISLPLWNAGDGANENPVRALVDALAIQLLKGDFKNVRTALLGNLKFGAEGHSLSRVLGMFDTRLSFVSPAPLSMPYDLTDQVRLSAYEVEETNDLATTLLKTDVLYLVNIDAQRVEKKIYDKHKNFYTLNDETFGNAKEGLVVLGEWDGADALLAPARPQVERAARAMLLTLIEG